MSIAITSPLKKSLEKLLPSGQGISDIATDIATVLNKNCQSTRTVISGIENSLRILEEQKNFCSESIAVLEEAGGNTVRARRYMETPEDAAKYRDKIKEFESLFSHALTKLDAIAQQAYSEGVNLLAGETLQTRLDPNGQTTIATQGIPLTHTALDIRLPNFDNMVSLQTSRIDVMNAMDMAVTLRNIITADIETLQIRKDLAESYIGMEQITQTNLKKKEIPNEISGLNKISEQATVATEPLATPELQEILSKFASSPRMEAKE